MSMDRSRHVDEIATSVERDGALPIQPGSALSLEQHSRARCDDRSASCTDSGSTNDCLVAVEQHWERDWHWASLLGALPGEAWDFARSRQRSR